MALILVLLDTGLRASELCSLLVADADRDGQLSVVGKGNKRRQVYVGTAARRALWQYLESPDRRGAAADEALFTSTGGTLAGSGLTPGGLHNIIQKLGKAARLQGVRSSPHTLRHTFAVNFLRGGATSSSCSS